MLYRDVQAPLEATTTREKHVKNEATEGRALHGGARWTAIARVYTLKTARS